MINTTDLWFTTFLLLKGYVVDSFRVDGRKTTYFFNITDDEWKKLKLQFNNEEMMLNLSDVKYKMESLKDLQF